MNKLISVIVPAYNAQATIEATLKSIMAQTYSPLEIVVVNDGSADDTEKKARMLAGTDPRIKVVSQPNGGLSNARNRGVMEASGELVGFVDSDDLIYPDMYRQLYEAYLGVCGRYPDGTVFIQTGREEIDENGNILPSVCSVPDKETFLTSEEFAKTLLMHKGDSSFCTRLCSRDFMMAHPFEEGVLSEDFSLQMGLTGILSGILLIPYIGYRVVHRAGSMTRKAKADDFPPVYTAILGHADRAEELAVCFPSLKSAARRFGLYMRMEYLLHIPVKDMQSSNKVYTDVVRYLRKHFADIVKGPYLTAKNRLYLIVLAICPKTARAVHAALMGLKREDRK